MKNDLSDPRDVALRRFEMIAPLLEPDLEPAEKALRREAILASQEAKGEPISARTLRRYLQNYREQGFDGLYPRTRSDQGKPRVLQEELLQAAVVLKKSCPSAVFAKSLRFWRARGKLMSVFSDLPQSLAILKRWVLWT